MKKFPTVFGLAMLLSVASAFAQGGQTGPLTWNINNGTLTISGNGEMPDYSGGAPPWYQYWASINNAVIENGVISIGNAAFRQCKNVISITIPNSVTSIRAGAFRECTSLSSITIPNSVTSIENSAFANSGLTSITIPVSISVISVSTFEDCTGLVSVNILTGVEVIDYGAFFGCSSLTTLILPESLRYVEDGSFCLCSSLTLITSLNPKPPGVGWRDAFGGIDYANCILQVPINAVSAYKRDYMWKDFNIVGIEVSTDAPELDVVKIYPNPTSVELRIESGELGVDNAKYSIYSVTGQRMMQGQLLPCTSVEHNVHTINVTFLPSGVYFLRLAGTIVKFVKE